MTEDKDIQTPYSTLLGFEKTVPLIDLIVSVTDALSWSVLVTAQNIVKMEGVNADVSFVSDVLIAAISEAVHDNINLCDNLEMHINNYAAEAKPSKKKATKKKAVKKVVKKVAKKKPKKLLNKAVKNFWADVEKSDKKPAVRSK